MRLTAQFVRTASKKGKYVDDGRMGLILHVRSATSKSWVQQIYINGKRRSIGLGSTRFVSLKDARRIACENQIAARTGTWQEHTGIPTFESAAKDVIALHAPNWKDGGKTEASWKSTLETYAFPIIGHMQVNKIQTSHVLQILEPLWSAKRATGKKVKQRIDATMKWSIAEGYCTRNPVVEATAALPKNGHQVKHMKALPYAKVSKAIKMVRNSGAYEITKLALEFAVLTACRSGEVRGAKWDEFDLENAVWTIPDTRMKMKKPHRVPLSNRAVEILQRASELAIDSDMVFPSPRGKQLSDNTLSKLLRDNQIKSTVHGFRSSFRDWAAEKSEAPREVCEFCLAHVEGSAAELAYRRTDYFDMRREIMQAWCDYLAS